MKVVLMCSLGQSHGEWNRTLISYIDVASAYIPIYVNNAATKRSFVVISTPFKHQTPLIPFSSDAVIFKYKYLLMIY